MRSRSFHGISLRHCFCYYAGMRGVPLPVVQSIVGHLTASMTKHYQSHTCQIIPFPALGRMLFLIEAAKNCEMCRILIWKVRAEQIISIPVNGTSKNLKIFYNSHLDKIIFSYIINN